MNRRLRFGLLVALVAVLLAAPVTLIVMRAGSGSAAFGDVEEVGRNRISAATLDIEVGSRTAPISVSNLAPGDLVGGQVEFRNAGTLRLRYGLTAAADAAEIADELTWWFLIPDRDSCPTTTAWRSRPAGAIELAGATVVAGVEVLSVSNAGALPARELDVDERDLVCLAVEFALDAPNAAQSTTVRLDLTAAAEQLPLDSEADEVGADADDPREGQP